MIGNNLTLRKIKQKVLFAPAYHEYLIYSDITGDHRREASVVRSGTEST